MNSALIIGSGFMGTSIALSINHNKVSCVEENLNYVSYLHEKGIYQKIFNSIDDVEGEFDLIVICLRQGLVLNALLKISSKFPDSTITDISSSKKFLTNTDLPENFVSSHPICGSHKVGPNNAVHNLISDKEVILIESKNLDCMRKLQIFWHSLGAKTSVMRIDEHDETYAYLSHFPHLFSFIYRQILDDKGINFNKYSGTSLKEILRLSDANKDLWEEIFKDNKTNIDKVINDIKKYLL